MKLLRRRRNGIPPASEAGRKVLYRPTSGLRASAALFLLAGAAGLIGWFVVLLRGDLGDAGLIGAVLTPLWSLLLAATGVGLFREEPWAWWVGVAYTSVAVAVSLAVFVAFLATDLDAEPGVVVPTLAVHGLVLWGLLGARTSARALVEPRAEDRIPGERRPLIRLEGVKKYFPITRGIVIQRKIGQVHAVDGIDLEVYPGETLGLVGETGCGKSTLARCITKLFDVSDGRIVFDGQDITWSSRREMRPLRRQMAMIFQDPYASLNPRKTVGSIIGEPFRIHATLPRDKIKGEVQQLMELVGLNPEHYNRFPHEFSGGQRQRIGVARALALRPRLIVCDEPVSALDVSIQAQILNLLEDLQEEFNLTYIFIAHDLSVVKHMSDRVAVMYLGKIVEIAPGDTLYENPKHPYTGALLSAIPIPDPRLAEQRRRIILQGDVPSPIDPPSGCRFHPRCPRAQFPTCKEVEPDLEPHHRGQLAACHFPLEDRSVVQSTA